MTSAKPRPSLIPGETRAYPVLPLRDIVVFPHMIVPLFLGRKKSIRALEEVMRSDIFILLATQKNASDDDPAIPDNLVARTQYRLYRPDFGFHSLANLFASAIWAGLINLAARSRDFTLTDFANRKSRGSEVESDAGLHVVLPLYA